MKRIYLTLGAVVALATGAFAQHADLTALVDMTQYECLNAGTTLYPSDTTINGVDQPVGAFGVGNNGPDQIDANSTIMMIMPICNVSSTGAQVFPATVSQDAPAGSVATALSYFPVDSINTLLNIDSFNAGANQFSSLLVPKNQLVDGQTYGFYVYVIGVGSDPNSPDNLDDSMQNNFYYVPVKWHCQPGTGINEMIEEGAQHIAIFPNPAQNELHFRYGFIKATTQATARVIDMTGRVIMSQELGQQQFGTKEFNMDISSLSAGNYLLEISTGYMNAVGKFTVQK